MTKSIGQKDVDIEHLRAFLKKVEELYKGNLEVAKFARSRDMHLKTTDPITGESKVEGAEEIAQFWLSKAEALEPTVRSLKEALGHQIEPKQ